MKKLLVFLVLGLIAFSSFSQETEYKRNKRTGLWDLILNINSIPKDSSFTSLTTDTLILSSDTISTFTFTDSITTDIGNTTTGVPMVCADTIYQNGVAILRIAVELADDASYNLVDAKTLTVTISVNDSIDNAMFRVKPDGSVHESFSEEESIDWSTSDTDGKYSLFDNGTAARFRNRSGSTLTFIITQVWEY